jgi:hypothetical protein
MSSHGSEDKSHAPTGRDASGPFHHVRSLPERTAPEVVGRLIRLAFFALLLLVVGSLYVIACASPALVLQGAGRGNGYLLSLGTHTYSGLECLELGWLIPQHWTANIFLLVGMICLGTGRSRWALVLGILAVSASASMMIVVSEPDELRSGYWLWAGSMCSFAVGSFLFFLTDWYRGKTRSASEGTS